MAPLYTDLATFVPSTMSYLNYYLCVRSSLLICMDFDPYEFAWMQPYQSKIADTEPVVDAKMEYL